MSNPNASFMAGEFWKKTLSGYNNELHRNSKNTSGENYKQKKMLLSKEIEQKVKSYSVVSEGATKPFFFAMWGIIIQKIFNVDDIIIGDVTLIHNNIKVLPVRISGDSNLCLKDFFLKVNKIVSDSERFSYYPFETILNDGIINIALTDSSINGLKKQLLKGLNLIISVDFVSIDIRYNEQIYDDSLIEQLIDCFILLCERLEFYYPNKKIKEIEITSDEDINTIKYIFNNTKKEYSMEHLVHNLISHQALISPQKIAIKFNGIEVTYDELDRKSNQLANYILKTIKVTQDSLIGILMERSCDLIISIIAILKTGAAYVPIDPLLPVDRINLMIDDANMSILLSNQSLEKLTDKIFKESDSLSCCINFDSMVTRYKGELEGTVINNWSRSLETLEVASNQSKKSLAYVIYTSGTTGKPKGVMIEHISLVNLIHAVDEVINLQENQTILCLTSISFDIFVLETLVPLSIGLTIIMADENQIKFPKKLEKLLINSNIDVLQITPSRLKLFFNQINDVSCFKSLKKMLIGGEPFSEQLLYKLKDLKDTRIYNMYGPTETTIWSTVKLIEKNHINIGKPIANTEVFILNQHNNILPVGITGELCISGLGVSRGYLNLDKLNELKFLRHPLDPTKKIYKTGDLGRWNFNGEIECFGRSDNQVKINGFRVEISEIESRLQLYYKIKTAVVVMKKDSENNEYLCAYFSSETVCLENDIRNYLKQYLPQYMIPQKFVQLKEFRLTINGKIDRNLLANC